MKSGFLILGLLMLIFSQAVSAQDKDATHDESKARVFDLYQWRGSDDASARIDNLINEVRRTPKSTAILFIYCGKTCQYGEVESHIRGIKNKLRFRDAASDQFIVLPGGYREKTETEFWIVPENACPPTPNSTIKIEDVKFKGTFKETVVPYECCWS